ncbi:hypothetical protein OIU76_000610 [Salix suchowensis]|nr:hypothetical protein OIU76_000610 [Salix suchowensis]
MSYFIINLLLLILLFGLFLSFLYNLSSEKEKIKSRMENMVKIPLKKPNHNNQIDYLYA